MLRAVAHRLIKYRCCVHFQRIDQLVPTWLGHVAELLHEQHLASSSQKQRFPIHSNGVKARNLETLGQPVFFLVLAEYSFGR